MQALVAIIFVMFVMGNVQDNPSDPSAYIVDFI